MRHKVVPGSYSEIFKGMNIYTRQRLQLRGCQFLCYIISSFEGRRCIVLRIFPSTWHTGGTWKCEVNEFVNTRVL